MSNPNCGTEGSCANCPLTEAVNNDTLSVIESCTIGRAAYNLSVHGYDAVVPSEADAVLRSLSVTKNEEKIELLRQAVRWQSTDNCQE